MRFKNFLRLFKKLFVNLLGYFLNSIYPKGKFIINNNCKIYVDFNDTNFFWYYKKNKFQIQEHKSFISLMQKKEPSVILDIGAHWGIFPAMLDHDKKIASKINKVICIEPDTKNHFCLKKTASEIKNFEIQICECAIGSFNGEILSTTRNGCCLQTYDTRIDDKKSKIVKVKNIKTLLEDLKISPETVTHIKVDIDGFESTFFLGNKDFLLKYKPYIMTEYWYAGLSRNKDYDIKDYWEFLNQNYEIYLCNFPKGNHIKLNHNDFEKINSLTKNKICNLLLYPNN